jgi:selenocysteine lyase/cysteine desulfurase
VQEAMKRDLDFSNEAPVYTMWDILEPHIEGVRRGLAADFGCDPEEMAITRNASEALEIAQLGMDLRRGDEVLTTDQDYPRMLTTWEQRVRREGITIKKISFPTPPPSMQDLVDRFAAAITPRTRVIHFCHITNLTGQIFPVQQICQLARSRGLEAIVDGAHAFAHFPFTHADLDCDYYGTSLHKWLLAPIGTGFLYVRREKIERLWPMMPAPESMQANIRKFEEIGTHPAANHNAIAEALAFHQGIGAERKAARLRYLRNRWMNALKGQPGHQAQHELRPRDVLRAGEHRDRRDRSRRRDHPLVEHPPHHRHPHPASGLHGDPGDAERLYDAGGDRSVFGGPRGGARERGEG